MSPRARLHTRTMPVRLKPHVEVLEDRVLPTLLGQSLFPATNPFNQQITNAPVAANSTAIINNVIAHHSGSNNPIHPDFGQDSQSPGQVPLYGIPYNVVHGNSTPKVHVIIDAYAGESDLQDAPIVSGVVIEGDYQSGPNPTRISVDGSDSHLIVWDQDNNIDYEFDQATRPNEQPASGAPIDGNWHAAQETVWNMNTNTFRTLGYTSADAAGLPILPGLVRPDEGLPVAQGGQGAIDHAIRFTLNNPIILDQFIYPASHQANPGNTNAAIMPPMGTRFRLKASVDISGLNPEAKVIAQAMKDYGLILADNGSDFFFSGASYSVDANGNFSKTWNDSDIQDSVHGLKSLHYADFEVVDLTPKVNSLSVSSGTAGLLLTITGQNFSGAAGHLSVLFVPPGNNPPYTSTPAYPNGQTTTLNAGVVAASSVTILDDQHLQVVVPSGPSGTVDIQVLSGQLLDDTYNTDAENARAPIFGYGISAQNASDKFTYTVAGVSVGPATLPNWTLNKSGYNSTVSGSGGTGPYTFSVSAGSLPTGLNLNTATGAITGTPTAAGIFNFTLKATDSTLASGTRAYLVTINPAVSISTASLPAWTAGDPGYGPLVAATGGTGALTFSLSLGALPTGLSLNAATGAITGTPTTPGTFNFSVTATDTVNAAGSKALSIVINAAVAVGPATLPAGTDGTAYNQTITTSGGTGTKSVSYAVIGTLPAGLTISPASPATNSFTISGTPTAPGTVTIAVTATDTVNGQATKTYTLTVNPASATTNPGSAGSSSPPSATPVGAVPPPSAGSSGAQPPSIIVTGADAGAAPQITIYDASTAKVRTAFYGLPVGFTGGARVALGDVNGDGTPDIIVAAGPGAAPQVTVYDGNTLKPILSFYGLPVGFTGGAFVAAGDVNHDGYADIIVSADSTGGPQVTITSGKDGSQLASFYATAPTFTGGIRVTAADINGDGFCDVIAVAGPGGGPQVTIFDGKSLSVLTAFYAMAPTFAGGLYVAAGDLNGDGKADIVVGAGAGGSPQVRVFDGPTQAQLTSFFALPTGFTGGVRVGVASVNGRAAVVAAAGPGGGPQVAVFDSVTLAILESFYATAPTFTGGMFVV